MVFYPLIATVSVLLYQPVSQLLVFSSILSVSSPVSVLVCLRVLLYLVIVPVCPYRCIGLCICVYVYKCIGLYLVLSLCLYLSVYDFLAVRKKH